MENLWTSWKLWTFQERTTAWS